MEKLLLNDKNYEKKKAEHGKVFRRLLNSFLTMYSKFNGLDETIKKHIESPNVKNLGLLMITEEGGTQERSLREAFAELGTEHLSFADPDRINQELLERKVLKKSFAPKISSKGLTYGKRGPKSKAISQHNETIITGTKRKSKPPNRFEIIDSHQYSLKPRKKARFSDQEISFSSASDRVSQAIQRSSAVQNTSTEKEVLKEENNPVEDDIFGSDSEDDSPPILCSYDKLIALDKSISRMFPALQSSVQFTKDKYFSVANQVVLSAIIQDANGSSNDLSFQPADGPCSACKNNVTNSIQIPVRKCINQECSHLNFCFKHMEHCLKYNHNVVANINLYDK